MGNPIGPIRRLLHFIAPDEQIDTLIRPPRVSCTWPRKPLAGRVNDDNRRRKVADATRRETPPERLSAA
jgi:hypothetical protein